MFGIGDKKIDPSTGKPMMEMMTVEGDGLSRKERRQKEKEERKLKRSAKKKNDKTGKDNKNPEENEQQNNDPRDAILEALKLFQVTTQFNRFAVGQEELVQ